MPDVKLRPYDDMTLRQRTHERTLRRRTVEPRKKQTVYYKTVRTVNSRIARFTASSEREEKLFSAGFDVGNFSIPRSNILRRNMMRILKKMNNFVV